MPGFRDISALEVSPFHGIAAYKSRHLLTYLLTHLIAYIIACITMMQHF